MVTVWVISGVVLAHANTITWPKHPKQSNQLLCIQVKDGHTVQCFNRNGTEVIQRIAGNTLTAMITTQQWFEQPIILITRTGESHIAYMGSAYAALMDVPFHLTDLPPTELTRQVWWTHYWYSLDDQYWVRFERDIQERFADLLTSPVKEALTAWSAYQVDDGEPDATYTTELINAFSKKIADTLADTDNRVDNPEAYESNNTMVEWEVDDDDNNETEDDDN